eukprot:646612-Rhodomonas_salina.1
MLQARPGTSSTSRILLFLVGECVSGDKPRSIAMQSKVIAVAAMVAHVAAFTPSMQVPGGMGRREIINSGLAAASAAPILANFDVVAAVDKDAKAPIITVFDHRGCSRAPKEYVGKKSNDQNDEMCVKVESKKVSVSEDDAGKAIDQILGKLKK